MKRMKPIYADFMKVDSQGRLRLVCRGTVDDLREEGVEMSRGLRLVFYNDDVDERGQRDDLIVEGLIEFDNDSNEWVAKIDHDKITNQSRLTLEDKSRLDLD